MDIKDKTLVRVYYDDIKDGIFIIPDGIKKIGNCAFKYCNSLKEITIPDSVKEIGEHAFYGCTFLKEITISNSVKEIGNFAFFHCTILKDVTVSSSLTNMTVDSFDSSSIQNFIVYGQKLNINKNNFSSELNKIREKELLDKIILYLINRGILDEKHYKRDVHKKFINEILAEYKNNNEYHYKDDFDKYMEEYINKNNLKKHDEQIDENLKTLNDNIVNHNIEELNPNSSIDIVNYGDELVKNIYKIEEIVSIIPINYGPTNTFLEK